MVLYNEGRHPRNMNTGILIKFSVQIIITFEHAIILCYTSYSVLRELVKHWRASFMSREIKSKEKR